MKDARRGPRKPRPPVWAQWVIASFLAAAAIAVLTLGLLAGLQAWRPGQRVAEAPSLALERAISPSAARREVDDTRILAR